ncbi:Hsp20/alpha crystallin family protein [Metabacillus malikii]|uniref:HSP20 family protein n=1 Tax=Metabacillus malikii TaxID=1504265 RepID=A0ABT9ZG65_9BACI|nr:Hsp20/alpha crystallin family protein [Metabacillus malikii]MDQ0230240.1 HSP20 family protein [Metabacillus malikii]
MRKKDPMKMINEFFHSRPRRTLLDTVDDVFNNHSSLERNLDVFESEEYYTIQAELPGVPKDDINIKILGENLVIEVKEQMGIRRKFGGVAKIPIPDFCLKSNMKAVYRHGLLTIHLRKKKPKKIMIE